MKQGAPSAATNFLKLMKDLTPGEGNNPMRIADDFTAHVSRERRRALELSAGPLNRLRLEARSSTPRTSPTYGLGLDRPPSPSLGVRGDNLLDYEPNTRSPATPVSYSILDQSTEDGDDEVRAEDENDAGGNAEGVYVGDGMVEAVLEDQGEDADWMKLQLVARTHKKGRMQARKMLMAKGGPDRYGRLDRNLIFSNILYYMFKKVLSISDRELFCPKIF